ncbi:MAG: amidase [Thermoleophilaceae bacterium]|jgi:aspartyl-tRNA(Asn)/glutamyl-tRNA(Gln) amidotransferase subunit A|nr:amidase [Thermoleophilaceae bacterium]MEA2401932.1 amidase [Thermoleophilaceae bacterium]
MSEDTPTAWPIARLLSAYARREVSPVEVAEQSLERIRNHDPLLNSFTEVTSELALEQAAAAERAYMSHSTDGTLLGVPVSIKDLFDVEGVVTTLGSVLYRDEVASSDARSVARLRRAGAVFVGKTNTAEFGQAATTENMLGDDCRNPWDRTRTAGGSSGGAAVSVAARMATAALGSDGGGSIRIPAAFCGVFGIKPSFRFVADDDGFRAMTDLACAGPLARTVADARVFLEALAGVAIPSAPVPERLRVAWCPRPEDRPVDPELMQVVEAAMRHVEQLGHEVIETPLPVDGWNDAFGTLVIADEWQHRHHLLDQDADALSRYARRSIEAGAHVTPVQVATARMQLRTFRERFVDFFGRFDLIATPTTAATAFPIRERPEQIDGTPVDRLWGAFPFTAPFNVSGCPAASIPCGNVSGLPVGLQLVGAVGKEGLLLDVCEQIESALGPAPGPDLGSVAPELPAP